MLKENCTCGSLGVARRATGDATRSDTTDSGICVGMVAARSAQVRRDAL